MRYRRFFQNLGFVEDSHILVRERKPTVVPCPPAFPFGLKPCGPRVPQKPAVKLNGLMMRGASGRLSQAAIEPWLSPRQLIVIFQAGDGYRNRKQAVPIVEQRGPLNGQHVS
jgi:hypothetical protein